MVNFLIFAGGFACGAVYMLIHGWLGYRANNGHTYKFREVD